MLDGSTETRLALKQQVMSGHEVAVNAVAVVGDCIVSGSGDTTIRVWRGGAEAAATPPIGAPIRALAQVPQSWGGAAFASAGTTPATALE